MLEWKSFLPDRFSARVQQGARYVVEPHPRQKGSYCATYFPPREEKTDCTIWETPTVEMAKSIAAHHADNILTEDDKKHQWQPPGPEERLKRVLAAFEADVLEIFKAAK